MKAFASRVFLALVLFGVWILLTLPVSTDEIIVGAVIAVIAAIVTSREGIRVLSGIRFTPKALAYTAAYVVVFLFELVKANLDVALRVVQPTIPINPGIVKVKTKLKTPMGRLLLANSITLTPGTITVETDGEDFYIHWISVTTTNVEEATQKIVAGFERYLEVICG
ncbi:MAG TPA: Na+/H+ antiporter subunit E [Spirochaetia bacterium]|nr:Na+/H+ antiporter subunit E [Spirochaetia bacterium]